MEAPFRLVDDILIEPVCDSAVVCERLDFGDPVSSRPSARQESLEINRLGRPSVSLANGGRERTTGALTTQLFDLFQQLDDLGERDLPPTLRRPDA